MQHVISSKFNLLHHHPYSSGNMVAPGIITRLMTWCHLQESSRLLWLGISLMASIGAILPLTLFAIIIGAGNNFYLWVIACVVNVPVLILNLAVQPTKLILPVLFFSWVIDAIIIALSFTLLFV